MLFALVFTLQIALSQGLYEAFVVEPKLCCGQLHSWISTLLYFTQPVKGHNITCSTCVQLTTNQSFSIFIKETKGYKEALTLLVFHRSHGFNVIYRLIF